MDKQEKSPERDVTGDRDAGVEGRDAELEGLFREGWEGRMQEVARELMRQERDTGKDYTEAYRQVSNMLDEGASIVVRLAVNALTALERAAKRRGRGERDAEMGELFREGWEGRIQEVATELRRTVATWEMGSAGIRQQVSKMLEDDALVWVVVDLAANALLALERVTKRRERGEMSGAPGERGGDEDEVRKELGELLRMIDESRIELWGEVVDDRRPVLVYRWRCGGCGAEGFWESPVESGTVSVSHQCSERALGLMRRMRLRAAELERELRSDENTEADVPCPSASQLPPGSVVATKWETWVKGDPGQPGSTTAESGVRGVSEKEPDDSPDRRYWKPIRESWSWRCQRCNMTGSGYSTWQLASRAASDSHAAVVCKLLVELTMRSTFYAPSTSELPPGTVVATKGETWIKEDSDRPASTVSREFPWRASQWSKNCSDMEVDGMLTSGEAEVLRVGDGG